jgi:hypothetical protein
MKAISKKTERQRDMHIAASTLEMALGAALLTADDVFGLTDELTDRSTTGYAEVINGYTQCGGIKAIKAELADRGIELCLDGKPRETTPFKHQRGIGEWITITDENGKKKTVCSHCKKGTAAKRNYCPECGADMRGKKDA